MVSPAHRRTRADDCTCLPSTRRGRWSRQSRTSGQVTSAQDLHRGRARVCQPDQRSNDNGAELDIRATLAAYHREVVAVDNAARLQVRGESVVLLMSGIPPLRQVFLMTCGTDRCTKVNGIRACIDEELTEVLCACLVFRCVAGAQDRHLRIRSVCSDPSRRRANIRRRSG